MRPSRKVWPLQLNLRPLDCAWFMTKVSVTPCTVSILIIIHVSPDTGWILRVGSWYHSPPSASSTCRWCRRPGMTAVAFPQAPFPWTRSLPWRRRSVPWRIPGYLKSHSCCVLLQWIFKRFSLVSCSLRTTNTRYETCLLRPVFQFVLDKKCLEILRISKPYATVIFKSSSPTCVITDTAKQRSLIASLCH